MGSSSDYPTIILSCHVCDVATTAVLNPNIVAGISKTDASFAALIWLLAEGPP